MSILIVDDSADMRLSLQMVLETEGFSDIATVSSAREAFAVLGLEGSAPLLPNCDVILMDIGMPGIDGVAACRRIKQEPRLLDVPVLMVTGRTEENALEAAFAAGATDYITKPIKVVELVARLRSALTLKQELDNRREREQQLLALTRQLQEANLGLERLSQLDALTGVANRRSFNAGLSHEWSRAMREKAPLSLIMVDVDHFKRYNDYYGHVRGDECLRQVAHALATTVRRPGDLLARYGGEEFAILLPRTGLSGAVVLAEEARRKVENLQITHTHSPLLGRVSISLGVASQVPERQKVPEGLVAAADQALYDAKKKGRNRVRLFSEVGESAREKVRNG